MLMVRNGFFGNLIHLAHYIYDLAPFVELVHDHVEAVSSDMVNYIVPFACCII